MCGPSPTGTETVGSIIAIPGAVRCDMAPGPRLAVAAVAGT